MSNEKTKQEFIELADWYKKENMTGCRMFRMIVATLKNDYNYDYKIK